MSFQTFGPLPDSGPVPATVLPDFKLPKAFLQTVVATSMLTRLAHQREIIDKDAYFAVLKNATGDFMEATKKSVGTGQTWEG